MYDFDQNENVVEITKNLFSNSKSEMVFETDNGPKGLFELLNVR